MKTSNENLSKYDLKLHIYTYCSWKNNENHDELTWNFNKQSKGNSIWVNVAYVFNMEQYIPLIAYMRTVQ